MGEIDKIQEFAVDDIYDEVVIDWPESTLKVVGGYHDQDLRVLFIVWLRYTRPDTKDAVVVYKTWSRKKLTRNFRPEEMLQIPDPKIQKIADKFEKMGPKLFEIRLKTLQFRSKDHYDV